MYYASTHCLQHRVCDNKILILEEGERVKSALKIAAAEIIAPAVYIYAPYYTKADAW